MSGSNQASSARIDADLAALAAITEPDRPWTRRAFSPKFDEGRAWLRGAFQAAGLTVTTDAGGNLLGRLAGTDPNAGALMIGSHSDTVPDGGRFDGVAGVVAALEVARSLRERGARLRHDLLIADFLAEEVSIFGVSCIGSRAMAGVLPPGWLTRDSDGRDLSRALSDVGGDAARLDGPLRKDLRAFFEVHIEQGRVLEQAGDDVGLVTAIAGISRVEIIVEGRADHAGTTLMTARADALVAAAGLVQWVEAEASDLARGDHHFTATVGEFDIRPNAANVVPGHVRMLIDARAERADDMHVFLNRLMAQCAAQPAPLVADARVISDNQATPMGESLVDLLAKNAERLGIRARRMVSGAGHDAAFIARLCPAAMVFVPCRDGRSHAPEEWAEAADIALGTEIIIQSVLDLDQQCQKEGQPCVAS